MSLILFKNVLLASEDTPKLHPADVLIEDGVIRGVDHGIPAPAGCRIIDGQGKKVLLPGLFDPHVHLREPGKVAAESIQSGTEAAINGGITGVVAMPDTNPTIDSGPMVQNVLDIAARSARIPVYVAGAITKGRLGEELAGIADMKSRGAVMITDNGDPVHNPQVLRRAMEYSRNFDLMLASHCETRELTAGGSMNEGPVSYKLGLPGHPAISEEICLARDCRLAAYTRARLHIQHVSTARGMETLRRYKNEGVQVTCEVAPHHLLFTEEDVGEYDTNYKTSPPLRTKEDTEKLLQGLIEGVFDCIATDHAPHTDFEKKQEFVKAPNGVTGLETAFPSLYHHFIKTGKFGWDLLVKRCSTQPRRLIGLEPATIKQGSRADCVLFDAGLTTTFTRQFMRSRSINTPFLNKTLDGQVVMVVLGDSILLDRTSPQTP